MRGHQDRVCRVAFHPSGDYVASASFDSSWRLWDVRTTQELLLQEGHSKEVYAIDIQNDGSLLASGLVILLLDILLFNIWLGAWTQLDVYGTCEQVGQLWC